MDEYFFDIVTTFIAFFALIISMYSLRRSYLNQKPHFTLMKMYFEPNDFHIYSEEHVLGNEKLKEEHITIIENTLHTGSKFSFQFIDNEKYIIINSLPKNYQIQDVRLILAPYQVEYVNTGYFASEITFREAIIKVSNKKKTHLKSINYQIMPRSHDEIFKLKVAYICRIGDYTSVLYERLLNKKYFDYMKDVNIAKDIINFERETYIIEGVTNSKTKFKCKLVYDNTQSGLKFITK